MTETASTTGSWRELLGAKYLGTSVVLAGGVALYATNEFLTSSLLPNTVAEIGGSRLYAWVTTLYLVGSVVAATVVSPMLVRVGARASYLTGLAVFGVASLVCGGAPDMEVLIAGRALQGVAGGLLAGLGYAVINTALPRVLWTRAAALVSAMWGVATVVGPATGGLFAQLGLWRWAFVAMAILTALVAILVPIALAAGRVDPGGAAPKIPVWSLLLLGAAALAVSVAQLPRNVAATIGLLAAAAVLVGLVPDRRLADAGNGVAAQRFWARTAEVALPDHGGDDGRGDGHHICAAVWSTTGAPDPADGRIPGRGTGARLDGQRDRQRLAGQPAHHRAGDRGRTDGDGSGSGAGCGDPAR